MGSLLLFFTSAQILYIATHPNKRRKCNSGFGKHVFLQNLHTPLKPLTDFKMVSKRFSIHSCSALRYELS